MLSKLPTLTIVVPCYNEEKNIPLLLERFGLAIQSLPIELILVDNGSTDGSRSVFDRLVPNYPFARVETVVTNQGYGYGIKAGLAAARSDYLGWTHADLQTDPKDIAVCLNIFMEKQYPENLYLKGDRKQRPFWDQVFTTGMSFFESTYLQKRLWDINAQPNVFHRSFYECWCDDAPDDFSLDLFVLYQAKVKGLDIHRFPVLFPERIHGESHWNTSFSAKWKFIKRTLMFSRELKARL